MALLVDVIVPAGLEEPVTLIVDASSMEDEGDLEVELLKSGEKVDEVDLQINCKDEVLKKYSVEFTPPSPEKYTVILKYADKEVEGSPLELNLSPPNARAVLVTQPPIGRIRAGQSIDIVFDTFPGGRGELTANCNSEEGGDIPVLVARKSIMMEHKVTFLPPQEDEYSLYVSYSGHSVKGSPFKIDLIPINASKVQCSKPVTPTELGNPIEMDVCTDGAGNAKLKADCKGKESGNVPVEVTKVSKNNYHLKFEPPERDVFTLSVLYGEKNVKDSPFVFNMASQQDRVRLGELHVPECAGTEEDVWIDVDCLEAGSDELRANCRGQNEEGAIPVSIEDCGSGQYRVKFAPRLPDVYNLTLFYGMKVIPGATFDINLLPKSDSKLVKHIGTFIPDDHEKPVLLSFDASQAGQGEMRARVNGISLAGPVASEVQLVNQATKEYQVSFVPDGADTYNVDVYWSNETIPGSPIYVKIVYPSKVVLTPPVDPELTCPVKVDVDTKLAGPGELSTSCSGDKTGDIETEILQDDYDNSQYTVSFRPVEADLYMFRFYFNNIELVQSPIEVDLRVVEESFQAEPQEAVEVELEICSPITAVNVPDSSICPTELNMTIGQPLTLTVDSVDGSSLLTAAGFGKATGEVPVSVTPNELEGSFNVVFDPSEPDVYTIEVKHGDEHVPGSPFIIDYKKPPTPEIVTPPVQVIAAPLQRSPTPPEKSPTPPAHSPTPPVELPTPLVELPTPPVEISTLPEEELPTHPITKPYLIQYVPEDNSLDEVVAFAVHDESCTRIVMTIQSKQGGKTLLALRAEKTGVHIVHITHNGTEIHGSPFKLDIVPADPTACKVIQVPERAYIGEEVNVTIDMSRAGTGDMHVIASVPPGGAETVFSHKENDKGNFVIRFTPLVPGKHNLNVRWADTPIPDSPIPIAVYALSEEVKQAKDAASRVDIYAKDVFGTQLKHSEGAYFYVVTDKAGQGEIAIKAKGPGNAMIDVIKIKDSMYKCRVCPVVSGRYHLDIQWNGVAIPGSPYLLDFTAEKTYIINDFDLEGENFVIGSPAEYAIDCSQEDGELDVIIDPSDCAQVDVSSIDGKDGSFKVRMVPQQLGNHEISIKFAGKHILRSPFHVQFETAEKPEQDRVSQEDIKLLRLSGLDFPIDLSDPAPEEASAPPSVHAHSEPAKVTAFGPGLEGGVIGQEGNFTIKTNKAGDGKLEVAVHGARGTFQTKLRRHPDSERMVLARYDPTNIGKYTIDILWLDEHIEGSPFVVDVKAQEFE